MTSTLFLAERRAAQSQSARRYLNNIKLHGNLERGAHKHFICSFSGFTVTESIAARNFSSLRPFCWDCIARIVSIPSPPTYPSVQTHFQTQGEHAWLPRCPGSGNVTSWQTGECGQTFVVSRQRPGRLSWSQGKLVSRETHCKLIMVVMCGRHAGSYCEPGEYALSHMSSTKWTWRRKRHLDTRNLLCGWRFVNLHMKWQHGEQVYIGE